MKLIDISLIFIIIIILYIFFSYNSEHLTVQSNEAIQDIGSIYNKDVMTITNLNVTGAFNLIPSGSIIMWSGTIVPIGWLICDGTNGTPDLRGRFVLGSGTGSTLSKLTDRKLGDKGGEENHTLTVNEIPSHYHQMYTVYHTENTDYKYSIYDSNGTLSSTSNDEFKGNKHKGSKGGTDMDNTMHTELVGTSGKIGVPGTAPIDNPNQAHNNMPPYYVLTYIMKS
jgi:microcystin-dependent protein